LHDSFVPRFAPFLNEGDKMKSTVLTRITGTALFVVLAMPAQISAQEEQQKAEHPPHYVVSDLGTVGGPPGQPYVIANNGLIGGAAAISAGAMHAVLWYKGLKLDIGKPGLRGPNSAAFGVNERGQAVGEAETLESNDEDFCGFNAFGFPSSTACLPFLWQNGVMAKLPTPGGPNGVANMINDRAEAVGYAENDTQENACPVFQFEPVIWKNGKIQKLHTFPGDRDGVAAWINDNGQVVGSSGTCGPFNPNTGLYLVENHALLWEKDGSVHDLGNLGGTGGIAGNHACAINNHSQVVGHSELPNETTFHGFLWTRKTGMRDLRTLPGDSMSLALGINDRGEVVGASLDANFSPRAFLWENGVMTDLNTITPASSGLYLLLAESINSSGEIVGIGATNAGEIHGFLATPLSLINGVN
jgi:probable HAF family extracellular repeat protein